MTFITMTLIIISDVDITVISEIIGAIDKDQQIILCLIPYIKAILNAQKHLGLIFYSIIF